MLGAKKRQKLFVIEAQKNYEEICSQLAKKKTTFMDIFKDSDHEWALITIVITALHSKEQKEQVIITELVYIGIIWDRRAEILTMFASFKIYYLQIN